MKALVTGATGFVGGHLVELLQRHGDEITALIRSPYKAGPHLQSNVRLIHGGLHDADVLAQAVEGQDVVYHVAGLIAARSEAEFMRGNRDGTASLLAAAERSASRPRFVLVSSLAAGGPSERGRPLEGDEPPRPVSQYGHSKLAAEQVVRNGSLPWAIVRPPVVYGPRDREVLKVFRLVRTGIAPVFGDGRQEISTIYALDLAAALRAVAVTPSATGIYFACDPAWTTTTGLVEEVGRAVGKRVRTVSVPQPLARAVLGVTGFTARLAGQATLLTPDKANEFFAPAWTGDPARLTRDTGWTAEYNLASGIRATAQWYREAGWLKG